MKKQRYWCFCFQLVTFPTKLVGSLISLHLSFDCVYCSGIKISCTLYTAVETSFAELSDIKYAIVNTHVIEPHVWISNAQFTEFSFKKLLYMLHMD